MTVDGREREYRVLLINGTPQLIGYGVNLSEADLTSADLEGLDLSFANLRGATLAFARMAKCNLSFVDLTDANVIGVDLRGATLRGAVTLNASLTGADLRGATYDRRFVRGAFISDELTPQYLASLGVATPVERVGEGAFATRAESPVRDVALADAPSGYVSPSPTQLHPPRGGPTRDHSGLLDELSAGIAELTTSEKWTKYLNVQSKFYRYSPNNVLLILAQNPDATRVAGYRAWQALDHQVRAKESALRIFAPMKYQKDDGPEGEKTSEIRGFKLVPVFDVSQTEGPDLPDVVSKLSGVAPEGVFATLTEFAESIGFRVERPESLESGANGETIHAQGRIRVASGNSEAQQAKTLAHEIGHALLHDPEVATTKYSARGLKELEAESTAYVICSALGMETGDYSFGYVAGWAGGAPEALQGIKASTGRIQRAAAAVLTTFEVPVPVVEALNVVSAGVSVEHSHGVDTVLDTSAQWRGYGGELARLYDIAEASEGRIQVIPVEPPTRDAPISTYEPSVVGEFNEPEAPVDAYHELEI
jgi:hypothetical protein